MKEFKLRMAGFAELDLLNEGGTFTPVYYIKDGWCMFREFDSVVIANIPYLTSKTFFKGILSKAYIKSSYNFYVGLDNVAVNFLSRSITYLFKKMDRVQRRSLIREITDCLDPNLEGTFFIKEALNFTPDEDEVEPEIELGELKDSSVFHWTIRKNSAWTVLKTFNLVIKKHFIYIDLKGKQIMSTYIYYPEKSLIGLDFFFISLLNSLYLEQQDKSKIISLIFRKL